MIQTSMTPKDSDVAYTRVSTDSEDQLNSLSNQIKHYTELFKKNGHTGAECGMYYSKHRNQVVTKHIPSIFADEGISGTKLKNREAFKYMLECAFRGEFKRIYVKNIARWARSVEDGAGILKKLKVAGIMVIFEDGNLNNFEHEMIINVLLSTAQEESRAKSVAVQFGIRKAQEAGKFTSACPYGYCSENGFLKPIPEQLEIVKEIYHLYLYEGWGSTKIVRYLNQPSEAHPYGIPTQKGRKWSQTQVLDILTNPIYTGKQVTHTIVNTDINVDTVTHTDSKSNKKYLYKSMKEVTEDDQIVNYFPELKCVSEEDFELVQQENKKRKEMYVEGRRPSTQHIFSNLLFCGNCGKALRRKKLCTWKRKDGTRLEKFEWLCSNHDTYYNDVCKYRNSYVETNLIKRVKQEIEQLRNNHPKLESLFKEYLNTFLNQEDVEDRIILLQEKHEDIKDIMTTNLKLLTKRTISEEQYSEQNSELVSEKKDIEAELYRLRRINDERDHAHRAFNNYVKFLNELDLDKLTDNPQKCNAILRRIVERIEAITLHDESGKVVKELHFAWNIIDKGVNEILFKKAEKEIQENI